MGYSGLRGLRRHYNADITTQTNLSFPEHSTQSGLCSVCSLCGSCETGSKAKTGSAVFPKPFGLMQFGAEKRMPSLHDLQVLPELFGEGVDFTKVKTNCEIGGFKFKFPVSIAGMGSTKVAHKRGFELAEGAALAGIGVVVGENVLNTYGEQGLKSRIKPFTDNYKKFGAMIVQANAIELQQGVLEKAKSMGAMGFEIKLGQGAKQGMGGEIEFSDPEKAKKYKKLGYTILQTDAGHYQRHAKPGSLSEKELLNTLIKYAKFDLPLWIKTGNGAGIIKLINFLEKAKKDHSLPVTCLTVDGFEGGTGMSPWSIMNETSLPSATIMGLIEKKPSFDILLAGGLNHGVDVVKSMMLGASGFSLGRAFLIAANVKKSLGVKNYVNAIKEESQMFCATQRISSISQLKKKKNNLVALSLDAERMFNVPCSPKNL
ncbi:MAG: alpha-hydroxy-acid oxidizing protein [archaeon]